MARNLTSALIDLGDGWRARRRAMIFYFALGFLGFGSIASTLFLLAFIFGFITF